MIFQTEAKTISAGELQEHVSRFLAAERPRRARLTDYYRGCQGVRKGPIAQGAVPTTSSLPITPGTSPTSTPATSWGYRPP